MPLGSLADYPLTTPDAIEGLILYSDRTITVPNVSGKTSRSQVVTPGVATQEVTVYRLRETLTGRSISVTSDATPTATEVVALLISAFRADPILNGMATVSGTTTMTITSRQLGTNAAQFNFTDGGSSPTNLLSVAAPTAAANASTVPFGRGMTIDSSGKPVLASAALSGSNLFYGVTGFTYADIENVLGRQVGGYLDSDAVNLNREGEHWVWSTTAVDPTASVNLIYGTGTDQGRFAGSAVSNSSAISSGAQWVSRTTGPGLAKLKINLP